MICPTCRNVMIVVEHQKIELDYCTNCSGTWFDSGEVELLLESHGLEDTKVFLDGILNFQEAVSSEKKRNCPICSRKMKKTEIGEQPKILIDICRDEHGLWFDGGEVTQLIRHLAGELLPTHDSKEHVISFLEEVFEAPEQTGDS